MGELKYTNPCQFYDSLWQGAQEAFAHNTPTIDPYLAEKSKDLRRGLSVILRLEPEPTRKINALVGELGEFEPRQYYPAATEYHVTVMSLLTCTAEYQRLETFLTAYQEAVAQACRESSAFNLRFDGVTATAEAVMIQGFPADDTLQQLRASIRDKVIDRNLPLRLRYFPQAAHVTVMRFQRPAHFLPGLTDKIHSCRARPFGTTTVNRIDLVENDWYMSEDKLRVVQRFGLGAP